MAKSRAEPPNETAARNLRKLVAEVNDAHRSFVTVMLDPETVRRITNTGKIGSDGSERARRNMRAINGFYRRAMDLQEAPGTTECVRHGLVMAAAELGSKCARSPQDNVQSSKILRAIDDLWYSMRAADDRALIGQIKKLAQDLCTFSSWPRSDWPGLV